MAFILLIGKPTEVDSESSQILGPTRIKVECVDPLCVRGDVDVFPSSNGFHLWVRVEGAENHHAPPPPPPPRPSPSDKHGGDDNGAANPSGGSGPHFTRSKWEGLASEERDLFKDNAPSDGASKGAAGAKSLGLEVQATAAPGAPPLVGTLVLGVCSNLPTRPASPSLSGIEDLPLRLLVL